MRPVVWSPACLVERYALVDHQAPVGYRPRRKAQYLLMKTHDADPANCLNLISASLPVALMIDGWMPSRARQQQQLFGSAAKAAPIASCCCGRQTVAGFAMAHFPARPETAHRCRQHLLRPECLPPRHDVFSSTRIRVRKYQCAASGERKQSRWPRAGMTGHCSSSLPLKVICPLLLGCMPIND